MEKYSALMLEHFKHPQHVGQLAAGENVYSAEVSIPGGDKVFLYARISSDGKIEDIKYQALGCPATIASMSWMVNHLLGKSLEEASLFPPGEIKGALALPTRKSRCAVLAVKALQAICSQWHAAHP